MNEEVRILDKFLALSEEKQAVIIEAGFLCFGRMGYKKASASDIAAEAGVSKAMLFHYFGKKKNLYLFLANKSFEILMTAFRDVSNPRLTDIFDKLINLTECKVATLKKHPNLLAFVTSFYYETDSEVKEEINGILADGMAFRSEVVFTKTDIEKFKDGVEPELVLKLLTRYSEGFVNGASKVSTDDLEIMSDEFKSCVLMLKRNLYKPEYL